MFSMLICRICRENKKVMLGFGLAFFIAGSVFKYAVLMNSEFAESIKQFGSIGRFALTDDFVRNGFFFGFPFIILGMCIRSFFDDEKIPSIRTSALGLLISLVIGLVEARLSYVVSNFNYAATGNQLKLFLFPATFFLICLLIRLSERTVSKDTAILRKLAGLVYFVHWEIRVFVEIGLGAVNTNSYYFNLLSGGLTLGLSLLFATVVLKLSGRIEKLKVIY